MNSIADGSVERIIRHLVKTYAPPLLPSSGDLHTLARELARYHVLVLLAERNPADNQTEVPQAVQECRDLYVQMYQLLLSVSFPSLTKVSSLLYHGRSTLIVVFEGEARRIIELLAGYVAPYVAIRQGARSIAHIELQDLMDRMLNKLDLSELKDEEYFQLREAGTSILKQMLRMQLRQIELTPFDEPFFDEVEEPNTTEEVVNKPSRPDLSHLPGQASRPFVEESEIYANGDVPDFIRNIFTPPGEENRPVSEPQEPRPTASPKETDLNPDTGPQRPVSGERRRSVPPPAPMGNGLPMPPLPPLPQRDDD
jgi:hypothetical protein